MAEPPMEQTSLETSVRENLAKTLKERNMEFRFKPVEDIMAPLIHQVRAHVLLCQPLTIELL